jgi:hypothetical protein
VAAGRAGARSARREVRLGFSIRIICALFFAALAAGCARIGDFERPMPSVVHDELLPVVGSYAAQLRDEPVSRAPLTDEERTLRDLAYAIIAPPITKQKWLLTIADMRVSRMVANNDSFNSEKYTATLLDSSYRSAAARYSRLLDDIRADSLRVTPFFSVARRVVDMDIARERSLVGVSALTPEERETAMARVAENRMLIAWVHRRFGERSQGYQYALERLFLKMPAPAAVDVERALRVHNDRLARIPVLNSATAYYPTNGPRYFKD